MVYAVLKIMKRIFYASILCILFLLPCAAQEKAVCPDIKVTSPNREYLPNEPMPFAVTMGEESNRLRLAFEWQTSAGLIIKGQGTRTITISTAGLDGISITGSVEIKGLPKNCINTFSAIGVVRKTPPNIDLACLEEKSLAAERQMLDATANQLLQRDKNLVAHFYIHTKKSASSKGINLRISRMIKYLVITRKIAANRIIFFVERDEPKGIRICPRVKSSTEILCEACQISSRAK